MTAYKGPYSGASRREWTDPEYHWHRTPKWKFWRYWFGYRWQRWLYGPTMYDNATFEYRTDKQRAREVLEERYAPTELGQMSADLDHVWDGKSWINWQEYK